MAEGDVDAREPFGVFGGRRGGWPSTRDRWRMVLRVVRALRA